MAISFPTSPNVNDSVSLAGVIYIWDGVAWRSSPMGTGNLVVDNIPWVEISSGTIYADVNSKIFVNTSDFSVTILLPPAPSMGHTVRVIDSSGQASLNNIIIDGNGNNILGQPTTLIVDTDFAAFGMIYHNATQGWVLVEK